jgi:molybdopterin/thiamine biosynthesis adenylyltransferase
MLTDTQIERYSRQIVLPEVGGRGQEQLLSASVAVVGPGDCGAVAFYLAAAGVGHLTIIDSDAAEDAAGGLSTSALMAEIEELNADAHISALSLPRSSAAAVEVARAHGVIIVTEARKTPASDTTILLNTACVELHRPLLWARLAGSVGCITALAGLSTIAPCCQCLLPQLSGLLEGAEAPLGMPAATTAWIGTMQATECIKLLLGLGATLGGRLLTYDGLDASLRETSITKDPQCTTCSRSPALRQR